VPQPSDASGSSVELTPPHADSIYSSPPANAEPAHVEQTTPSAEPSPPTDRDRAAFALRDPSTTPSPLSSATATQAEAIDALSGDGVPGAEGLDGEQAPSLTIEKTAPSEIQVGKEATFQIKVRNVGRAAAHDVVVLDRVPKGTRFVNAAPSATQSPEGQLLWQLGTLQPGDESLVSVHLMPTVEGEIGSVAQVVFQAQASARTICTKPELTVQHTGPQKALIGDTVTFDITVTNPGSGAATGVVLEEDVPEGLGHVAGRELEFEIGTLRPGETRQMQLTLKAEKPGVIENVLLVRGDANLIAKDALQLEIVAPALDVSLSGPKIRYLERPATYEVAVSNPGTAPAREIELVTYLPKGLKFVSADHKGQYEAQNHAVYWSLEELPPDQTGVATLTLLPVETGEQKLTLEGRAEMGLQNSSEAVVQVDSLAELQFTVRDEADPIEVGSDTVYLITLTNSGSSAATNIQLAVNLPSQLKPVGGDGPTRVTVQGTELAIDPLARLGPGEEAVYKLRVQGLDAGPQRVQVQLQTAEVPLAVTREEITRVYADR
jgi:uncharacterized repeat protein (TIGR01451 family)